MVKEKWKYDWDEEGHRRYKYYTEDSKTLRLLLSVSGAIQGGFYTYPDGVLGWDVIVPQNRVDFLEKLLTQDQTLALFN